MACGACKKKSTKKTGGENEEIKENSSIFKKIGVFILAVVVSVLALPFIFIMLVSGLYQGWVGDGFDLSKVVKLIKKKEAPKVDESVEINPDDYELVGVEKIA